MEEPRTYKPLADIARTVSAEGSVLLENRGNVLPLKKGSVVSVFGRTQIDYVKSGTGSGGLVWTEYVVNIADGIRNCDELKLNEELFSVYENWIKENPFDNGDGWAKEPWSQVEMVPEESTVCDARKKSDTAVIVLGRTAGEDRDNTPYRGSWYLTEEEEALLEIVSKHFEKTVVLLNVGNIIDMQWVEKYNIKSVLYIWQGGQEGGNACADILCGKVNPCGRLSDTIARDISLYSSIDNFGNEKKNVYAEDIYVGYRYFETFCKEDVLYPFGYGLSYTEFKWEALFVSETDDAVVCDIKVTNTGSLSGKDVLQIYFEAPQGLLGKASRELCAFAKTKFLAPGESETLHFEIKKDEMSAYDDSGITGNKSCYVLEAGDYNLYMGASVRSTEKIHTYTHSLTTVTKKCSEALAPDENFLVLHPEKSDGGYVKTYKKASVRTVSYDERIKQNLPPSFEITGDRGIKLADVKSGRNTMGEFVAQLSCYDLACLLCGEGMCSPKVRPGSAGCVGGTTESLANFGIPVIAMHDGPSGIRIDSGEFATSMPNGTCIACTWDETLAQKLYDGLSAELTMRGVDAILGPGVNIHRVPLNGRNFEYFSEDPFLSGKIAAALIRGVAARGNSATIKHFAANSQEYCRRDVSAVMTERAAREIYLKTFEIPVREAHPTSLMTSYNPINGIWSAQNYELTSVILRDEWDYSGFVVTDWWPKLDNETDFLSNDLDLTGMVEAQNDVYMPSSDATKLARGIVASVEEGRLTIGQLQRNAVNILRHIMNSHALERFSAQDGVAFELLNKNEDELTTVISIENPSCEAEFDISAADEDAYQLMIEYSSDEPSISQMTMSVFLNNVNASCITVNGTDGKTVSVKRLVSVSLKNMKLKITYPEKLIKIKKLELKKGVIEMDNMLGVMLDCSRNAVLKVETVKEYADILKEMGYNTLLLYIEDTYEIKTQPYFGHLRGRYTKEEITQMDTYCRERGIELVPCMQTLAHLEAIFKWNGVYSGIKDCDSILLADDEKTYEFIEDMIRTLSESFSSRKIHIGMDEAYMVGKGKYEALHGVRDRFDIINGHLHKVCDIVSKYGMEPMIWSDMFCKLAMGLENQYDKGDSSKILEKAKLPENVSLVYWDYYSTDYNRYVEQIRVNKAFGRKVYFAGGAWTWKGIAPDNDFSIRTSAAALKACRDMGVKDVFITVWGDDGNECPKAAILPSLMYVSEVYNGNDDMDSIKSKFKKITSYDFDAFKNLDKADIQDGEKLSEPLGKCFLYNDIFTGIRDFQCEKSHSEYYKKLISEYAECKNGGKFDWVFDFYEKFAAVLEIKSTLGIRIREAYLNKDNETLKNITVEMDELCKRIEQFHAAYQTMWFAENKPFGFEIMDIRFGGLKQRVISCKKRLCDYIAGNVKNIPELEEPVLERTNGNFWSRLVSPGRISMSM